MQDDISAVLHQAVVTIALNGKKYFTFWLILEI